MTALCGGGTSGPKAGVAETVIFTAGALASVLNNKGGAWATLAAPLLGVLTYQVEELCETDPPADPGLTPEDYLALLNLGDWPAVQVAVGKLAQLVKIAIWYDLCECKTTATPNYPPELLAPPANTVVQPTDSGPCWTSTRVYLAPFDNTGVPASAFHTDIFPSAPVTMVTRGDLWTGAAPFIKRPTTWQRFRLRAESLDVFPAGNYAKAYVNLWETNDVNSPTVTGVQMDSIVFSQNYPGGPVLHNESPVTEFAWPNGGVSLSVSSGEGNATGGVLVQATLEAYCGAAGAVPAPCGTDPAVLALLQQILQLVTVTQRQAAPFGYVAAGDVAGLTGQGEYVIDTPLIAATLLLTTLPSHYGMAEGSPDRLYDVGWLARGTVDGYEDPKPITSSPQMIRLEGHHTRIGYSLSPGVVGTLRLHQREP